ncbi:MAG: efflux RND transporter periplasmic adaptor subunit [Acidobacteria bacterium]|nr:MAG: efflux RND transporter periplasmic adaptor subunit [Acidobacteriota bacterium]
MHAALTLVLAILTTLPACRRAAQSESEPEPAVPVIVERVRLGNIRGTVSATGIVSTLPGATFSVVAAQPARIAEITRNAGEAVKAGDILVRFEFPTLRAQSVVSAAAVKASELRARQARLAQSRVTALVAQGAASRLELDAAERELATAEADLLAARAALTAAETQGLNTTIRAPFDGTVTERLHNPGDLVRAEDDDPILRLIDPKQVQVTAGVAAADVARFAVGASARVVAQGAATPEVLHVSARPTPEGDARSVDVTLTFDMPTSLQPGIEVGVEIDAEQRSNVPLVPAFAVLRDNPAQPVVVVAEGNTARRRPVAIGLVDAENIEILSGLKSGELIITQGHSALRDGTPISVSAP